MTQFIRLGTESYLDPLDRYGQNRGSEDLNRQNVGSDLEEGRPSKMVYINSPTEPLDECEKCCISCLIATMKEVYNLTTGMFALMTAAAYAQNDVDLENQNRPRIWIS